MEPDEEFIYEAIMYKYHSYSHTFTEKVKKGEVLEKVLDEIVHAYAKGITFEQLLKESKTVRTWYNKEAQSRAEREATALREAVRQAKLAEKKRLEDGLRAAVMAKMTPEEIEAFGLNKKRRTNK